MQLRQLQVASDSIQDRLLLRFSTSQNEEVRVWLTRRFLRQIWPALLQMAEQVGEPASLAGEEADSGDAGSKRDDASFEQAFVEDDPSYPLGKKPLLASEAKLDLLEDRSLRLSLSEGRERSCSLHMDGELLQFFCAMLRAAERQAEWNLGLDYGEQPAKAAPQSVHTESSSGGSKLLH
ncbi:hypothetical protein VX159_08250 [Dechloromonas sp. ZY10]|uniref:hypothetical protein n=1 Tax=Dechloromonas aquae TaxID=2664436 RepID=UPI003527BF73